MSGDPSGLALLVDTLHQASPADAAEVLAGLGDSALAAGVEAAGLPIAVVVGDFVAGRGGPESAAALTRRALAGQTIAEPHNVLRALLARTDPAVDAALFFPQPEGPHQWARQAVLRDRVGADGRPVVDLGFRGRLAAQVERIAAHARTNPNSRSRVEDEILGAVLGGDDPDLVELALPAAVRRGQESQVLRGVATLARHGRIGAQWRDGLRAEIQAAAARIRWRRDRWDAAVRIGDAAAAGKPVDYTEFETISSGDANLWGPRRLPKPTHPYAWTAPGLCAGRHTLPWDDVLARAVLVDGDSCPGLEEAAAREDLTPAMREELETAWSRAAYFVPRPDVEALTRAQREAERTLVPALRHFAVRELVIRGLTHHTLTASEVVWTVAPAAETLALAAPVTPALDAYHRKHRLARHPVPAQALERPASDVRHAVADLLADALGEDPKQWRTLLIQAGAWPGTFGQLVSVVADGAEPPFPPHRAGRWPRGVDATAVLLTLAPAEVADAFLAEADTSPAVRGILTRILDRGPIPAALLEHALGPQGTPEMRRAIARNKETAYGVLVRLVEGFPAERETLATVYLAFSDAGGLVDSRVRRDAVDDLRARIVLHCEAHGGLPDRLQRRFRGISADLDELRPALASQDPVTLHGLLGRINTRIDPGHRAQAYASLARLTGPEPVWALELKRVGTLDRASASVRASMAAGDIGPLLEAADLEGVPSYLRPLLGTEPADPAAEAAPVNTAELVRAELDGRPDRWRTVVDAWTRGPATPLDALVRELS